jgi:hypothetical protein
MPVSSHPSQFDDPMGAAIKTAVFGAGSLAMAVMVIGTALVSSAAVCVGMVLMVYWIPFAIWYATTMSNHSLQPTGDPQLDAHRRLLASVHARGDERLNEVCKRLEAHWRATSRHLRELDRALSDQRSASSSGSGPSKWLEERRAETAAELARVSEAMRWLHAAVVASGGEDDESSVSEALAAAEAVLEVDRVLKRAPLPASLPNRPILVSGVDSAR